ncbi:hypothetical protein GHK79_11830 [Enterococcus faecium]|uniref:hypothetical protein n=1 Tax=Enterococcus faecium TaxID=1352 RepID=UPI001921258B|nr:hypothetical protein [Enterococcus faecium]EME3581671.1 hypothetical protein [Enterococcus faecium]MBL3708499.1 hypothetical protein [Enterococcus faecium]
MSLTQSLSKNKILKEELRFAEAGGSVEKNKKVSFEGRTDVLCLAYTLSNEKLGAFVCLVEGNRVVQFSSGTKVEMKNPRLVEVNNSYPNPRYDRNNPNNGESPFINYTERMIICDSLERVKKGDDK